MPEINMFRTRPKDGSEIQFELELPRDKEGPVENVPVRLKYRYRAGFKPDNSPYELPRMELISAEVAEMKWKSVDLDTLVELFGGEEMADCEAQAMTAHLDYKWCRDEP